MTTCKRHQLIHKYKFEWLVLGKRTIKCKSLKHKFYRIQDNQETVTTYFALEVKNLQNGPRKNSVRVCSGNCKKKYTNYGWHFVYRNVITRQRHIEVVTTHEQYNNHSHNIGLHITVSQWRHMINIITTHITLGYINCIRVTTHEKHNDNSNTFWLHESASQWRHMNNIMNTQIYFGYK